MLTANNHLHTGTKVTDRLYQLATKATGELSIQGNSNRHEQQAIFTSLQAPFDPDAARSALNVARLIDSSYYGAVIESPIDRTSSFDTA